MSNYIMNRESLKQHCEATCERFKDVPTSGAYGEHSLVLDLLEQTEWISVSERLPETDNKNSINNYNVLLWVKNKSHPEEEPQIYLGKLRHINGDDGSGNFWGVEIKPCDWTIWGWSYFCEPEVIAWMPLPKPYKAESEEPKGETDEKMDTKQT